jgi:hypothetical protein
MKSNHELFMTTMVFKWIIYWPHVDGEGGIVAVGNRGCALWYIVYIFVLEHG